MTQKPEAIKQMFAYVKKKSFHGGKKKPQNTVSKAVRQIEDIYLELISQRPDFPNS